MLQALLEESAALGALGLFLAAVGVWSGVFTGAL